MHSLPPGSIAAGPAPANVPPPSAFRIQSSSLSRSKTGRSRGRETRAGPRPGARIALQTSPTLKLGAQIIYAVATSVSVRRLASEHYQQTIIASRKSWMTRSAILATCGRVSRSTFQTKRSARCWQRARKGAGTSRLMPADCLLGDDRALLLSQCRKAIEFASRRAAHSNPSVEVHTKFRDLDQAIYTPR